MKSKLFSKSWWKLLLIVVVVLLMGFVAFPQFTAAYDLGIKPPTTATTIPQLIDRLAHVIFVVGVAIAPVMILVAAFYFMTSAGNPNKISKAKRIIMWTLIGVLILYLSDILVSVIRNTLGVD